MGEGIAVEGIGPIVYTRLKRVSILVYLQSLYDFGYPSLQSDYVKSAIKPILIHIESPPYDRSHWAAAFKDKKNDPTGTNTDQYLIQAVEDEDDILNWRCISEFRGGASHVQLLAYQLVALSGYISAQRII